MKNTRTQSRTQRGFTILLAALVGSLVLALGISVFTIAQKQLILSSVGRASQFAFYAADSGAECALYHDMRMGAFATSAPVATVSCDEQAAAVTESAPNVFTFEYSHNGYCVNVEVLKAASHPRTTISADGYSVACSDITTSARALQRTVELRY